ncbi:MAG: uL13 family ribosomal protein, partial [Patescibacteria group bacterium]|nr:uL13 family ribosomal protein [Patescibacteria group bacterium]
SGYPGGLKVKTFKEILEKKPEEIIRHSVMGMLPQNKLRDIMLKRLYVFPDENHPYGDKIKEGSRLK